eukprot:c13133_g2_i5.p1 GENE.c13133_g2_i5~~c13133_g2_i5.p1  ORF type:complete len:112 (-),score=19.77 c13133_g2_i5:309-644(-)
MLMSCTRLVSLTLEGCTDKNDDVEWLASVLAHLTHLSLLSLWCNSLGPERTKRVCGVLCRLSHMTSLNLGRNMLGTEGIRHVCDCIHNMPSLESLILAYNEIEADGVTCSR